MTSAELFESVYRGESPYGDRPPWEIGRPQPALVALEEAGLVRGAVLEPGCGTAESGLHLASLGYTVTGVDCAATAISVARRKAAERGLPGTFKVGDVLDLGGDGEVYDTVVDHGTARMFDAEALATYASELYRVCRPGAVAHVLAISASGMTRLQSCLAEEIEGMSTDVPESDDGRDGGPDGAGPPDLHLSVDYVRDGFVGQGWTVESTSDSVLVYTLPSGRGDIEPSAWLYRFRRA